MHNELLEKGYPITHTSQMSCWERATCKDYSLTKEELEEWHDLKKRAKIMFEGNERWDLIKDLYRLYFSKECPEGITTRDWLELGFQGDRPERDLRGGGILSLELIKDFLYREKPTVKNMSEEKNDFFFAVSSINISFFMKKYFHLSYGQRVEQRPYYCSRKALKNFCRLLVSNRNCYNDMHHLFLLYFYHGIWMDMKRKGTNVTLLNFNQAFDRFKQRVIDVIERREYQAWIVFETVFKEY